MIITNNKNVLSSNNEHLLDEAFNTSDLKKKYDALFCYKTILNIYSKGRLLKSSPKYLDELLDVMETYINSSIAWDRVNEFYVAGGEQVNLDNEQILKSILKSFKKSELFSPSMSELEMLNKVELFYQSFDDKMRGILKDIINYDKNILFLTKSSGYKDSEFKYNGVSISSNIVTQKSIFVENYNNLVTYISLIHEFGHLIASHNHGMNNRFDTCAEVEALFPELVAIYELMNSEQNAISCYLMVNSLDSNLSGIDKMFKLSRALDLWQSNKFKVDNNYYDALKEEDISKKYFKKLLDFDFYGNITYINGIIIALKLLYIYIKDKEEAISLYKGIVMTNGHDRKKSLRVVNKIDAVEEVKDLHNSALHILTKEMDKKGH